MQDKNLKATTKNLSSHSSFIKSRFLVYSSPVVNFMITFHHFDPSELPIPLLHKYVHDVLDVYRWPFDDKTHFHS